MSWASASGENQRAGRATRGPTLGGYAKGRRGGKRKNAPSPGCVSSAAGGTDLVSLGFAKRWLESEVGGTGGVPLLLSPRRIVLARTGHTKQR